MLTTYSFFQFIFRKQKCFEKADKRYDDVMFKAMSHCKNMFVSELLMQEVTCVQKICFNF